jgi:hypothetical protein
MAFFPVRHLTIKKKYWLPSQEQQFNLATHIVRIQITLLAQFICLTEQIHSIDLTRN